MKHQLFQPFDVKCEETDSGRFYISPRTGQRYPSVTTFLSAVSDNSGIEAWKAKVGEEVANKKSRQAINRGSQLHEALELYLLEGKRKKLFPNILSLFFQCKERLDRNLSEIHGIELPLFSDQLKLAGRADCIGVWNDEPSIIDFKTSTTYKREEYLENYFLQGTAYAMMCNELYETNIRNIVLLIAIENSSFAQIVEGSVDDYKNLLLEKRKQYSNK